MRKKNRIKRKNTRYIVSSGFFFNLEVAYFFSYLLLIYLFF